MIRPFAMHPSFEELTTSLAKLDALLKIAGRADFAGLKSETIFNYFWITEDILDKAKNACEDLTKENLEE